MMELIDDFFAEYPTATGESDKADTGEADEVIDAIAKLVAELGWYSRITSAPLRNVKRSLG
jgi:hypothetical protein